MANNVIKARIGNGANGAVGGTLLNSPNGADSTVIKFRVQLNDDCALWQCITILENKAYLFGTGQISGIANGNNGTSDVLDANGCPTAESGLVNINVSACAPFILTYDDSVCIGVCNTPPPLTLRDFQRLTIYLDSFALYLKKSPKLQLIATNLNIVPWSSEFRTFKTTSNLFSSRRDNNEGINSSFFGIQNN